MRTRVLAASLLSVLTLLCGIDEPRACAQSDSSATELTAYAGAWTAFLPKYRAGSIVANGGSVVSNDIFLADQNGVGPQGRLRGLYHFTGYRTMLEGFVSIAGFDDMTTRRTFSDPDNSQTVWLASLDGNAFLSTPDGGSATYDVNGDVFHHEEYAGLRDRFDLTDWYLGLLDIGCGFHHMRFDQNFSLDTDFSTGDLGSYREELETNYFGGQIVATLHRYLFGHRIMLDTGIGLYGLNADYDGTSRFRDAGGSLFWSDNVSDSIKRSAFSTDIGFRFEMTCHDVLIRTLTSFRYISDMPTIDHPQTITASEPASLSTDRAYFLTVGLEFLL